MPTSRVNWVTQTLGSPHLTTPHIMLIIILTLKLNRKIPNNKRGLCSVNPSEVFKVIFRPTESKQLADEGGDEVIVKRRIIFITRQVQPVAGK